MSARAENCSEAGGNFAEFIEGGLTVYGQS